MNRLNTIYFCGILVLSLILNPAHSQQTHFSQYFSNPLELSPALTGYFDGGYRLASVYRSQWAQGGNPFITIAASAESKLLKEKINGKLGLGAMFISDRSNNDAFTTNAGGLSLAYNMPLDADGNIELGVGLQGAFTQKRINPYSLTFESQFVSNGFNTSLSTPELIKASTTNYFNLSTGVLLNFKTNKTDKIYLGCGLYNINSPKSNLLDSVYKEPIRTNLLAGGSFSLSPTVTIQLSSFFSYQQQASEIVIGGVSVFDLNENKRFSFGTWYRINDAFIPYLGLGINDFEIGISNDFATGKNKTIANMKNSLEISLRYTSSNKAENKKLIPWY